MGGGGGGGSGIEATVAQGCFESYGRAMGELREGAVHRAHNLANARRLHVSMSTDSSGSGDCTCVHADGVAACSAVSNSCTSADPAARY